MNPNHKFSHINNVDQLIICNIKHNVAGDDWDHPSPVGIVYDFSTDKLYLYCPVCQGFWKSIKELGNNDNPIESSAIKDLSRVVPATIEQIVSRRLASWIEISAQQVDSAQASTIAVPPSEPSGSPS